MEKHYAIKMLLREIDEFENLIYAKLPDNPADHVAYLKEQKNVLLVKQQEFLRIALIDATMSDIMVPFKEFLRGIEIAESELFDAIVATLGKLIQEKEAYINYIEGSWKSGSSEEQLQKLQSYANAFEQNIIPYYKECKNLLKEKQLEQIKERLEEHAGPVEGELWAINITDDFIHNRQGYTIQEVYVPFYYLSMNTQHQFNIMLNIDSNRYCDKKEQTPKLLKTFKIEGDILEKIKAIVRDQVLNRPAVKEFVELCKKSV